ncbi:hypothetical protein Hanom_Chr12g01176321 [Helianthus anomalus]
MMDPMRSGRTPLVWIPDRVLTKWSISAMQASSSQDLAVTDGGWSGGGVVEVGDGGWWFIVV